VHKNITHRIGKVQAQISIYRVPGFKHVITLTSSTVIPVVNISTTVEPEILGGKETVGSVNVSCHQKNNFPKFEN